MKIRQGFVSNSSSSSFVIYASKEAFDATLEECSEIEKEIVNLFLEERPELFLGRHVYSYSYLSGNNGNWYYEQVESVCSEIENEEEIEELLDFAFGGFGDKLTQKAEEIGEGVLVKSQDW